MDGNAISIEVGISGYAAKNFKTFYPVPFSLFSNFVHKNVMMNHFYDKV